MKLCVSTYSEMVAVDAIVVYFQSTPNFPSWARGACGPRKSMKVGRHSAEWAPGRDVFRPWTSRVRSPSPALFFPVTYTRTNSRVAQMQPISGVTKSECQPDTLAFSRLTDLQFWVLLIYESISRTEPFQETGAKLVAAWQSQARSRLRQS